MFRQANAFSVPSNQLEEKFKPIITSGTDVLMSHVPPYYVRDMNSGGKHTGSGALLRVLEDERVNIAMHVFGHNHDGHGVSRWEASHEEIGLKEGDESEAGGSSCDGDEDDRARKRSVASHTVDIKKFMKPRPRFFRYRGCCNVQE